MPDPRNPINTDLEKYAGDLIQKSFEYQMKASGALEGEIAYIKGYTQRLRPAQQGLEALGAIA